jgi:hypothetical protein
MEYDRTIRRAVTRRSGHSVSGVFSGNEVFLYTAQRFYEAGQPIVLEDHVPSVQLTRQFESDQGILAFGGYFKASKIRSISAILKGMSPAGETLFTYSYAFDTRGDGVWFALGGHEFLNIEEFPEFDANLIIECDAAWVEVVGFRLGAVDNYVDSGTRPFFNQNTGIYIPGIYYHDLIDRETYLPLSTLQPAAGKPAVGSPLVLKGCNRCSRLLPIDLLNEQNALDFSNHCVSRAPCSHRIFSRFEVLNGDLSLGELSDVLGPKLQIVSDDEFYLVSHFGFQLECRSCKKFKVNAPLNPLRTASQHREDGLRRRAFEVLTRELTGADWVYKNFYLTHGIEFDDHIWEKFGRRCFACGRQLETSHDMHLDHTMPLAALWPLDETATCLCATCNSEKSDKFPVDFARYSAPGRLEDLSAITGIDLQTLQARAVNQHVIDSLVANIQWFFDDFLARDEYQAWHAGKFTAHLVFEAVQRSVRVADPDIDLLLLYEKAVGGRPASITIDTEVAG